MEEKIEEWMRGVGALARIAKRYSQTAYTRFAVSLQSEWQYVCCAVSGVEALLQPVEDAIVGDFIPALLDIQQGELTPTLRCLLGHGIKQGDMNLRMGVLLLGGKELDCKQPAVNVRDASREARKEQVEAELAFVDELKAAALKRGALPQGLRWNCSGALTARCSSDTTSLRTIVCR